MQSMKPPLIRRTKFTRLGKKEWKLQQISDILALTFKQFATLI